MILLIVCRKFFGFGSDCAASSQKFVYIILFAYREQRTRIAEIEVDPNMNDTLIFTMSVDGRFKIKPYLEETSTSECFHVAS